MKITDLLSSVTIKLNASATDKKDILNQAIDLICKSNNITDKETFKKGVFKREEISSTGVGEGIAIPHCKSKVVKKPQLAAMVVKNGVDFDSFDSEPIQLLFLIAAPDSKDNVHLDVLARLSTLLMRDEFKSSLLAAKNKKEFMAAINRAEADILKDQPQEVEPVQQEVVKPAYVVAPKNPRRKITAKRKRELKVKVEAVEAMPEIIVDPNYREDAGKVVPDRIVVNNNWPKVVCVTACPTGIAHTYMAKEALEQAAKKMGISIKVETRGQNPKDILTDEEIEHADAVIVAADIAVPMDRFDSKPLVTVGTGKAIKDSKSLIESALSGKIGTYHAINAPGPRGKKAKGFGGKERLGRRLYKQLLNGLSYMIPFVVAGGILMSIAFIIDRCCGVNPAHLEPGQVFGQTNIIAQIFYIFGANIVLGLMIPILAGFISHSIAGKQGLVPGFAAGIAATTIVIIGRNAAQFNPGYSLAFNFLWFLDVGRNGLDTLLNSNSLASLAVKFSPGFFGGLFGGFAAGYLTLGVQKMYSKFSKSFQGVRDILLVPLTSALFIMIAMLFINAGFTYVTYGINKGLGVFQGAKGLGPMIGLGILLAAVCAIDMGGPISKAAHLITIDWITQALREGITSDFGVFASTALGASIAGSMVPPICLAFACWLFPQKFSEEDRKPAAANLITGIFGITEGAIPYCIKNPKTWIATITGSIIAGITSVLMSGRAISPEGGTIAFAVATSVTWTAIMSLVAVIIGSIVAAFIIGAIYKDVNKDEARLGLWKGIPLGRKPAEARKHALDVKLANKDINFNQLAYDDYIARINAVRQNLDLKLGEKRGRLSKETCDRIAAKYELKKSILNDKIDAMRIKLQQRANDNKFKFDATKFALLKVKVQEKKNQIDKEEEARLAKLAAKQAAREAKIRAAKQAGYVGK